MWLLNYTRLKKQRWKGREKWGEEKTTEHESKTVRQNRFKERRGRLGGRGINYRLKERKTVRRKKKWKTA